ncbi:transposase, partial [Klebsiella pneumoniae]|uniref:transposase n=1 Tax=Klebsiella pneumoniae TaxID=573 RepID=UPI00386218CB
MSHQLTFADSEFSTKRRQTRKEIFLSRMEQILPWQNMVEVIEPFYPKAGNGRRPYPLETMLRIHCMQHWYNLSDVALEDMVEVIEPFYPKAGNGRRPYPLETMLRIHCMQHWYNLSDGAMEDALYEIASMRLFARLSLDSALPDRTTIMNFRHLLEQHQLARQLFKTINRWLAEAGVMIQTRKEIFLSRMEQILPWQNMVEVIEPFYPKAGNGRRPYPLETMLRIHCMQHWYNLSDGAMEDALYEIASMRLFARLSLDSALPDRTTIMNFRHLLEQHQLARQLFK